MTSESPIGDQNASTVSYGAGHEGRAERHAYDELTVRVFRALYRDFDLYTVGSTHVAVAEEPPWFSGASLGSITWQISEHEREEGRRSLNQAYGDVRRRHAASVNVPYEAITLIA
jgi:hypothetical protein